MPKDQLSCAIVGVKHDWFIVRTLGFPTSMTVDQSGDGNLSSINAHNGHFIDGEIDGFERSTLVEHWTVSGHSGLLTVSNKNIDRGHAPNNPVVPTIPHRATVTVS